MSATPGIFGRNEGYCVLKSHGRLGLLQDVEEAEGEGAERVDHGVQAILPTRSSLPTMTVSADSNPRWRQAAPTLPSSFACPMALRRR